jgi:hypothetical protein
MNGTISKKLITYHQQSDRSKNEVFTARGGIYASDCCDCGCTRLMDETICCCCNCCDDCNNCC